VSQTGTTTTYLYPFKWYSVASSTGSGAKFATTTDYVFNGDSLVATVDQQTASGNATGTAKTRYVHPDHLGSTNVVTDENGNVVQTLDYYPYGSTRISVATSTRERRQFIGQFTDDSTLSYLNARYYDGGRGEFMSEDPVSWGDPKQQSLADPQSLNTFSYSTDNPITKRDPSGKYFEVSVSGTDSGFSGSLALQFTILPFVVNLVPAGGFGGGLEGSPFSASYTPGPVPQEDPGTISYGGDAALGGGLGYNRNGTYVPQTVSLKNQSASWSFVVGVGADVYARKKYPIPLFGSTDALIGGSAPRDLQLVNGSNFSTPNYVGSFSSLYYAGAGTYMSAARSVVPQGASHNQSSSSGIPVAGGGNSLPATVTQGGIRYYRNSSGLLSFTPGH
jgi:RHS repeat-associated protein